MLLAATVVDAAPVSFAGSGGQITLTSGGNAQWQVVGNFGTSDGTPTGTCNTTGTGLAVADGVLGAKSNAFDGALAVWVDGVLFTTPNTVDVSGGTLTAGPTVVSSLEVTVRHTALPSGPVLRTLISLHNPAPTPVTASLAVVTNLGSDGDTAVRASSDGEGLWEVTSDDAVAPTGPVVLTVANGWYGPHGYANSNAGLFKEAAAFACSGTEGARLRAEATVPPGGTSHFMMFTQLDDDNAGAIAAGEGFDGALAPALLDGLDDATQLHVVNFYLPGEVELVGGGSGEGSRWYVHNQSQPTSGAPSGGDCAAGPGLSILDAVIDPEGANRNDAFDGGAMLFVDGEIFAASLHPTVTASSYADGPFPVAGLDTTVAYTALPGSATLRTFATFTNPGPAPITATVTIVTNVGSDANTGVRASSSGDDVFDVADRWIVTSDTAGDEEPLDAVVTHVLAGPGPIPVAPALVSREVFDCSTTQGVLAELPITVPAGETRALLFFHELGETNAGAATNASRYDTFPSPTDELVAGLDPRALADVVNWGFCAADSSVCDDGDACTVDACAASGGCSNSALPATPAFLSVGCRLGALLAAVQALPAGKLRDALAAKAQSAKAASSAAEGLAGGSKTGPYKKQLRKAGKALKALEKRLRSKPARKAVDQATRDALTAQSSALRNDLKALGTS
ncbi:MAG TPA: hypothetical protein VGR62_25435 [Candidatus Binatia bacterium]|nr:hypothetical protein [Candidatus Binatia bacterium]